jgi:hypothetical protein
LTIAVAGFAIQIQTAAAAGGRISEHRMEGIYFGLCMVGVWLVIQWYIANDGRKDGEPTTGLLAMRVPTRREKKKAEVRRKRREPRKWRLPSEKT